MNSLLKIKSNELFKYYIILGLIFVCCIAALVTIGGRVASDGYNYYAYLRSAVIDGDLDFHNDFQQYPGPFWDTYKPKDTVTGHYTNVFSIGPAILWAPFYLLAHLYVLAYNAFGGAIPADGFSEPYQLAVSAASQLYAFVGLILVFRLSSKYFSPAAAFVSTTALWLGTFLIYYMIFEPSMSHSVSFFAVTLFVYLWHKSRQERTTKHWIWLGLSAGLMMLVRWQNGVFMLLPALEGIIVYHGFLKNREYRKIEAQLKEHLLFLGATVLAFLPQMVVWKIIYGGFLTIPQGNSFMKWTAPFMVETLFSSRHGLFSWHPLLLLGALGWLSLFRRDKLFVTATILLFLTMTYVNSVVSDWWSGWAFGMRRFDGFLVFFGLGLAGTFSFLANLVKKRPMVAVSLLVVTLVFYNVLFMNQFRGRVIHQGGTVSFETVFKNMITQVYQRTGNPFSIPANIFFAQQYDESPGRYDTLVGVYVDDKHFWGPRMDLGRQRFYLGQGWSPATESWQEQFDFVRSNQANPVIYMPLRNLNHYIIKVRLALLDNAELSTNSGTYTLTLNGRPIQSIQPDTGWQVVEVPVTAAQLQTGINVLQFQVQPEQTLGIDYIEFIQKQVLIR